MGPMYIEIHHKIYKNNQNIQSLYLFIYDNMLLFNVPDFWLKNEIKYDEIKKKKISYTFERKHYQRQYNS